MNATEQATTPEMAQRIASLVSLFREEFPDANPDLSPWLTNEATQAHCDPNSIDVSFHFPGWHPTCRGTCVLVLIYYAEPPNNAHASMIGIEAMGYGYQTLQWRFSTISDWSFGGPEPPVLDAQGKIKHFCHSVFQLYQHPIYSNHRAE